MHGQKDISPKILKKQPSTRTEYTKLQLFRISPALNPILQVFRTVIVFIKKRLLLPISSSKIFKAGGYSMFVKTITIDLPKTDLKNFYITGDRISVEDRRFQKFFTDATSDGTQSPPEHATCHFHTTLEIAHDLEILEGVGEKVIDLSTPAGKLAARRRLNLFSQLIREHQKGKASELLVNGYRNAIGWFKLESGEVIAVGCYFFGGYYQWRYISWPLQKHSAGGYYLSDTNNIGGDEARTLTPSVFLSAS